MSPEITMQEQRERESSLKVDTALSMKDQVGSSIMLLMRVSHLEYIRNTYNLGKMK